MFEEEVQIPGDAQRCARRMNECDDINRGINALHLEKEPA